MVRRAVEADVRDGQQPQVAEPDRAPLVPEPALLRAASSSAAGAASPTTGTAPARRPSRRSRSNGPSPQRKGVRPLGASKPWLWLAKGSDPWLRVGAPGCTVGMPCRPWLSSWSRNRAPPFRRGPSSRSSPPELAPVCGSCEQLADAAPGAPRRRGHRDAARRGQRRGRPAAVARAELPQPEPERAGERCKCGGTIGADGLCDKCRAERAGGLERRRRRATARSRGCSPPTLAVAGAEPDAAATGRAGRRRDRRGGGRRRGVLVPLRRHPGRVPADVLLPVPDGHRDDHPRADARADPGRDRVAGDAVGRPRVADVVQRRLAGC